MSKPAATKPAPPDELERLVQRSPELAGAAAFYRSAAPLLQRHRQATPQFRLDPQHAQRKLAAGIPLLVGEELPFDPQATRALFLSLCRQMERARPAAKPPNEKTGVRPAGRSPRRVDFFSLWSHAHEGNGDALRVEAVRQIRRVVESGALDLQPVWAMLAGGETRKLELTAGGLKLDPGLLRELARLSLKPAFQAWSEGLHAAMDFDQWGQGVCPLCGSAPSIAEIQGKEAARHLRCGLCAAAWRYPNLKCAFCQNSDYKQLVTLTVEGEEDRYKVQACNVCRGYIKTIKTFDPIPVDDLLVQELATLHLDLIAADYDYLRPAT